MSFCQLSAALGQALRPFRHCEHEACLLQLIKCGALLAKVAPGETQRRFGRSSDKVGSLVLPDQTSEV